MTRRAYLGIDCGTQSTKALLVDAEALTPLALGRAGHDLIARDDGAREQHPGWWIEALQASVRQALDAAGAVEVAGIGVSGQQHGLVCLDAADRPVRAAKLWNDTTTGADCAWLTRKLGGLDAVLALTGNPFLPGYTAPKVSWLHRSEPEVYANTARICLPHDYLNFWLTGAFVTEPGDASGTGYFDVRARRYAEPVLTLLDSQRDWERTLPALVPSRSAIGGLRGAAAEMLGLPAGIPVSAGGGDNMCAAIGVGAIRPGPVVVSLGTSGTAFAYTDAPAVDSLGEAAHFCDSTGGWLPLTCTLGCTVATGWAMRLFGLEYMGLERALAETSPGAGPTFLPHLDGERTPSLPNAAGLFAGLRTGHGPAELVRAVVEGVTFGLAYGLDVLRRTGVTPTQITLVGGGASSDGWAQLCADVFELPVQRPSAVEAAARGAALQARWVMDDLAPPDVAVDATWEPRQVPALVAARERAAELRALAAERGL
ncbi:MAG: xylulokinase [Chloroflexi bacterium]|nr:xylulokinase [Chloroflexota bacterium]